MNVVITAIVLFACAILIVGGIAVLVVNLRHWRRGAAAAGWPVIDGRVIESTIAVAGGDWQLHPAYRALRIVLMIAARRYISRPRFVPRVTYEYTVAGSPYRATRLRFGLVSSATQRGAEERLRSYPVGAAVKVHYNPRKPADAVLVPGVDRVATGIAVVCGAAVVVLGVAMVVWLGRAGESHDREVKAVAFSPNGQLVVSGGGDNAIRLWQVASGRQVRSQALATGFSALAVSPDGKLLAGSDWHAEVWVWELATGQQRRAFTCPVITNRVSSVWALAFSPDSTLLACAGGGITARDPHGAALYNLATGQQVRAFTEQAPKVTALAFSPDGQLLATGGYDKTIDLWDTHTGELQRTITQRDWVTTIAFSPDGRLLASGSPFSIQVWDTATGALVHTFLDQDWSLAFSPDGKVLATGGKQINLWDTATWQQRGASPVLWTKSERNTYGMFYALAFSPDGTTVASGDVNGAVELWDVTTMQERRHFQRAVWSH